MDMEVQALFITTLFLHPLYPISLLSSVLIETVEGVIATKLTHETFEILTEREFLIWFVVLTLEMRYHVEMT
jgi:hypothetical protein